MSINLSKEGGSGGIDLKKPKQNIPSAYKEEGWGQKRGKRPIPGVGMPQHEEFVPAQNPFTGANMPGNLSVGVTDQRGGGAGFGMTGTGVGTSVIVDGCGVGVGIYPSIGFGARMGPINIGLGGMYLPPIELMLRSPECMPPPPEPPPPQELPEIDPDDLKPPEIRPEDLPENSSPASSADMCAIFAGRPWGHPLHIYNAISAIDRYYRVIDDAPILAGVGTYTSHSSTAYRPIILASGQLALFFKTNAGGKYIVWGDDLSTPPSSSSGYWIPKGKDWLDRWVRAKSDSGGNYYDSTTEGRVETWLSGYRESTSGMSWGEFYRHEKCGPSPNPPIPPRKPQEPMDDKCCKQILLELKRQNLALGVDEFVEKNKDRLLSDKKLPKAPERLTEVRKKGHKKQTPLKSLLHVQEFIIRQIDRAVGHLPFTAKIIDSDPSKKGNQKVEVEVTSLADGLKELIEVAIESAGDTDLTNLIAVRILYECGFIHQGAVQTWHMVDAICDYLDFKNQDTWVTVPFAFDPRAGIKVKKGFQVDEKSNDDIPENEQQMEKLMPRLLQPKDLRVPVRRWHPKEKKSQADLLQEIMRAATLAAQANVEEASPERLKQLILAAQATLKLQNIQQVANVQKALTSGQKTRGKGGKKQ